jgi:hypothetical protein
LEALAAVDGPTLARLERHGRILAARRTRSPNLYAIAILAAILTTTTTAVAATVTATVAALRRTRTPLCLARLAAFGFVRKVLVSEKRLFSRRPHEIRTAVRTLKNSVLEVHQVALGLVHLSTELFPIPLARQRLFGSALIAWFQVERVLLDVLDNVFLLDFPLETAECALDRLAFLHFDFSHD